MVEQRDAGASERQRILHRIDFFQDVRRDRPAGQHALRLVAPRAVPHVPLVEAQHDALGRAPMRGDGIGDRHHLLDEAVHQIGAGEEGFGVVRVIVQIGVQRDPFDMVEAMLEHDALPFAEGRHGAAGGAAGGELDRGVDPLHHLRGLDRDPPVFVGGLRLHLPRPVHLVAEAPELHVVRQLRAVLAAQIGQRGAARMIAVFHQVARRVAGARAEIDGEHRLDAGRPAPGHELVRCRTRSSRWTSRRDRAGAAASPPARRRPPNYSPTRNCRRDSA